MTLQKKQFYLNKVLSKHYKMLKNALLNNPQEIPKSTTFSPSETSLSTAAQSIRMSILTIDSISPKDFPSIIDVTVLNGLRKTKKAVILYEGNTVVPAKFCRSISKLVQKHLKAQESNDTSDKKSLKNPQTLGPMEHLSRFKVIDTMLGAGVRMHKYKLSFNSQLSLQYLNCLKRKQDTTLKNVDRLGASLMLLPEKHSPEVTAKSLEAPLDNQGAFKRKEVRLSKMELSSLIAQTLHKIRFFKIQESLGESFFNTKRVSNVLGALVEIKSTMYFISDKELKQCGLAGGLKHSAKNASFFHNCTPYAKSKLKSLIYSKKIKDKEVLLKTKYIEPNIIFFNFLNIATRTYVIHNIKRIFSKLINILSRLI